MDSRIGKFSLTGVALIAGFTGGWLSALLHVDEISFDKTVPRVLRASKFEVVDSYGRVVAALSDRALDLHDAKGTVRATLRLEYNDKGVLAFSDGHWEGRAVFGFLGTDTPSPEDDDWGISLRESKKNAPVVSIVVAGRNSDGSISVRRNARYAVWP